MVTPEEAAPEEAVPADVARAEGEGGRHEAAPWEVLANEQYLHLRDDASGEETWAMVCGHTDYAGRGLNLYGSNASTLTAIRSCVQCLICIAAMHTSRAHVEHVRRIPKAPNFS